MRVAVLYYDDDFNTDTTNIFDALSQSYDIYAHCWCKPCWISGFSTNVVNMLRKNKHTKEIVVETHTASSNFLQSMQRVSRTIDDSYDVIILSAYKKISFEISNLPDIQLFADQNCSTAWSHDSYKLHFFGKNTFKKFRDFICVSNKKYNSENDLFEDFMH